MGKASLRILHVLTHGQVTRGGAIQAMLLARAQRELGHEVAVVCNAPPNLALHASFVPWIDDGFEVRPFAMSSPGELWRFRSLLRESRPDVLHAHRDDALLFAWFATALGERPRAFVSQRGTTHPFRLRLVAHAHWSPRVHRIIAVAAAVAQVLVRCGVPRHKVEVVYGSFDVGRFDPDRADGARLRAELGLNAGERLVVQVGALNRKKAPAHFVRAAARVLARHPATVFALAGKGDQESKCKKLARELGVQDRVRFLGFRSDVPDVYAAADVAVNTSTDSEGLTGAIREALAMARPVVATATDGNPEVVRPGETGLLVPVGDVDALAAAVCNLLEHPGEAVRMGAAGRELVLELMHPDVRVPHTEAVYRDALAAAASPRPAAAV